MVPHTCKYEFSETNRNSGKPPTKIVFSSVSDSRKSRFKDVSKISKDFQVISRDVYNRSYTDSKEWFNLQVNIYIYSVGVVGRQVLEYNIGFCFFFFVSRKSLHSLSRGNHSNGVRLKLRLAIFILFLFLFVYTYRCKMYVLPFR